MLEREREGGETLYWSGQPLQSVVDGFYFPFFFYYIIIIIFPFFFSKRTVIVAGRKNNNDTRPLPLLFSFDRIQHALSPRLVVEKLMQSTSASGSPPPIPPSANNYHWESHLPSSLAWYDCVSTRLIRPNRLAWFDWLVFLSIKKCEKKKSRNQDLMNHPIASSTASSTASSSRFQSVISTVNLL